MTVENFCFYLQNRLIQTGQTEGQLYSDISPLVFPAMGHVTALNPWAWGRTRAIGRT
jgi:hypothetical protein